MSAPSKQSHCDIRSIQSEAENNLSIESRERRYRELRLLHTFTSQICPTIAGTHLPELLHTWTVEVPRLALDYEPLLNSIMALSCLYLATESTDPALSSQDLLTHRAAYLEATLQQHRQALGLMTKQTADATCFASVVLTVDAFASLRDRVVEPYEPPMHWLQMSRGISGVFKIALVLVQDYPEAKIRPIVDTTVSYVKSEKVFNEPNREGLSHLLEPRNEVLEKTDMAAYEDMVSYIGSVMAAHKAGEHPKMLCRRLTAFPVLIPVRYIDLLRLQRPRALVLLAHFFGLACYVNQFWWIGQTPVREIQAIEKRVGPEWQDLMSWPLQAIQQRSSVSAHSTPSDLGMDLS